MSVTEDLQDNPAVPYGLGALPPTVSAMGEELSEEQLFPGAELIRDLSRDPKVISPIYFYDDRGSRLFEELCKEPSYYLYRTELALLAKHSPAIAEALGDSALVELGCGNGTKTKLLLRALSAVQSRTHYLPIDVNRSYLLATGRALARELPNLTVEGLVGTYDLALDALRRRPEEPGGRCFLSLGSSLGNLEDQEISGLAHRIHLASRPGDRLLLGLDLHKDEAVLKRAYNNQTALLTNFAVLEHINWRFGANFDIFKFRYQARYNGEQHRIEELVESVTDQCIRLSRLKFTVELAAGETIRTEISRKFVLQELVDFLRERGFAFTSSWQDDRASYALCLFERMDNRPI